MKIYYGKAVYDRKEINASLKVLKNKSLTLIDGPAVKDLENKIIRYGNRFWSIFSIKRCNFWHG